MLTLRALLLPSLLLIPQFAAVAQPTAPTPPKARAKLLLVGTFHFQDAGLDEHKPAAVNMLSELRQKEIEQLVNCLAGFRATKIGVEAVPDQAQKLAQQFTQYRAGTFTLPANEIYQVGFRLAKRLELPKVDPIDAKGRWYEPYVDPGEYAAAKGGTQTALLRAEMPWESYYNRLYAYDDSLKLRQPLRDYLLYLNSDARVQLGQGRYLIGTFKVGTGDEFPGPDAKTAWFNRNLKIFFNIVRQTEAPEDRVLVVIGAGHLSILKHLAQTSPEYELVDLASVLTPGCGGGPP